MSLATLKSYLPCRKSPSSNPTVSVLRRRFHISLLSIPFFYFKTHASLLFLIGRNYMLNLVGFSFYALPYMFMAWECSATSFAFHRWEIYRLRETFWFFYGRIIFSFWFKALDTNLQNHFFSSFSQESTNPFSHRACYISLLINLYVELCTCFLFIN